MKFKVTAWVLLGFLWGIQASAHEELEEMDAPVQCKRASLSEIEEVKSGNQKYSAFIEQCKTHNIDQKWCEQLTHPNQNEISKFKCTYGNEFEHRLIHPDESTWENAFRAAKIVQRLITEQIKVVEIYNWWRPEVYNRNVGGSPLRHPHGVSVDIRMSSVSEMEKAHKKLCEWRKKGEIRAVGYYGSTGLHVGVADEWANTWGKPCK